MRFERAERNFGFKQKSMEDTAWQKTTKKTPKPLITSGRSHGGMTLVSLRRFRSPEELSVREWRVRTCTAEGLCRQCEARIVLGKGWRWKVKPNSRLSLAAVPVRDAKGPEKGCGQRRG